MHKTATSIGIATLIVAILLSGCTGLTVNPVGRPCDESQPCGPGTICVDGTCVEETIRDAWVKDGGADAPLLPDLYVPDTVSPDIFIVPDGGCPPGFTKCGNECAKLSESFNHCGACNNPCPSGAANRCDNGTCVCGATGGVCPDGLNCIGGACICVLGGRCQGCCDGNACLAPGSAQSAAKCGQNGEPCKGCDDGESCTADTCSSTGACQSSPKADGTPCDDQVLCTHTDECASGLCKGTPYSCDDNLPCTTDTCTGNAPPNHCTSTVAPGNCLIAGTCYADKGIDPADPCQQCLVSESTSAWSMASGCVFTIAGSGAGSFNDGPALSASFNNPYSVFVEASGKIYVADLNNHRIRLINGGQVSTLAGTGTAGSANGPALTTAQFDMPSGVVIDSSGAIYVSDRNNDVIRKISGGQVSTFAGDGTGGWLDGSLGSARFDGPSGIAIDSSDAIYVADRSSHVIRKISGGQVTTIAGNGSSGFADGAASQAQFATPVAVAVHSASGTVYVADLFNHRIRRIAAGQVDTVAGSGVVAGFQDGPASSSRSDRPTGVTVDGAGTTVYFADANWRVRTISAGVVSTLAGQGVGGYQDGPLLQARFSNIAKLFWIGNGDIYVADHSNHRIRLIRP